MPNICGNHPVGQKAESESPSAVPAGEKRTTLSLSLTVADKKALKILKHEMTVASIIHQWIVEHTQEAGE